jgi:hypothetical protein
MRCSRRQLARLMATASLGGPLGLVLVGLAPSPALASYGIPTTQTYTLQLHEYSNGLDRGTSSCTASFRLGPDGATIGPYAVGSGVQSSASVGWCSGNAVVPYFWANTYATDPIGAPSGGS